MTKVEIEAAIAAAQATLDECASFGEDCPVCDLCKCDISELEQRRSTEVPEEHRALSSGALKR